MVLRGIFLLRKKEIDWFYEGGAAAIYPDGMLYRISFLVYYVIFLRLLAFSNVIDPGNCLEVMVSLLISLIQN